MHSFKWNPVSFLIVCGIILSAWVIIFPNSPALAGNETISPDQGPEVMINALVMEVHPNASMMVVGEKRVYISKMIVGKIYKTHLLDQNDSEMDLSNFSRGDRVIVKGFRLSDGGILAQIVKKTSHHSSDVRK